MKTAMANHIDDLEKIKEMVLSKKVDKDLEESVLTVIVGCIENANSHLDSERDQMRRIYNQGGTWASQIGSETFFYEEYSQEIKHK